MPRTRFLGGSGMLAARPLLFRFSPGKATCLVTIYGIRTDFLHVPLIWIMAEILDRDDVEKLGSFIFDGHSDDGHDGDAISSPMDSHQPRRRWRRNRQIYGALGRIRPPGFFRSSRVRWFFSLAAAFLPYQATTGRRLWLPLVAACGIALFIAMPVVDQSRHDDHAPALSSSAFRLSAMLRSSDCSTVGVRFAVVGAILLVGLSFFRSSRKPQMFSWTAGIPRRRKSRVTRGAVSTSRDGEFHPALRISDAGSIFWIRRGRRFKRGRATAGGESRISPRGKRMGQSVPGTRAHSRRRIYFLSLRAHGLLVLL